MLIKPIYFICIFSESHKLMQRFHVWYWFAFPFLLIHPHLSPRIWLRCLLRGNYTSWWHFHLHAVAHWCVWVLPGRHNWWWDQHCQLGSCELMPGCLPALPRWWMGIVIPQNLSASVLDHCWWYSSHLACWRLWRYDTWPRHEMDQWSSMGRKQVWDVVDAKPNIQADHHIACTPWRCTTNSWRRHTVSVQLVHPIYLKTISLFSSMPCNLVVTKLFLSVNLNVNLYWNDASSRLCLNFVITVHTSTTVVWQHPLQQ